MFNNLFVCFFSSCAMQKRDKRAERLLGVNYYFFLKKTFQKIITFFLSHEMHYLLHNAIFFPPQIAFRSIEIFRVG